MAAKRLGQFLSNVTGTSGQILRVKSDESGFEMYTPAGLPAYTITNDTTDRVIDADVTTSDELADVLATLIKDITTMVGGPVAFQWSTSEQVWPFEKDSSGRILYCKEIAFGAMPNNGTKNVAHNIPGLVGNKIHNVKAFMPNNTGGTSILPLPLPQVAVGSIWAIDSTIVSATSTGNWTTYDLKFRIIYAK